MAGLIGRHGSGLADAKSGKGKGKTVTTTVPGVIIAPSASARLICDGIGTLELPWWPTDLEYSNLAPNYTEKEKTGAVTTLYRTNEPLEALRIVFTLRGATLNDSAGEWVNIVRVLAKAKPICRLMLAASDRGTWVVTEAGYSEADWTAAGDAAVAEVTIQLRQADHQIPVGPVAKKKKKSKKKAKKKTTTKKKTSTGTGLGSVSGTGNAS